MLIYLEKRYQRRGYSRKCFGYDIDLISFLFRMWGTQVFGSGEKDLEVWVNLIFN